MIRNETPPIIPTLKSYDDTTYFPAMNDDHFFDNLEAGNAHVQVDDEKFATFQPGMIFVTAQLTHRS